MTSVISKCIIHYLTTLVQHDFLTLGTVGLLFLQRTMYFVFTEGLVDAVKIFDVMVFGVGISVWLYHSHLLFASFFAYQKSSCSRDFGVVKE